MADTIRIGTVVTHPRRPEWGPGKVLAIEDGTLIIFFRDDRATDTDNGTRRISRGFALGVAADQSDRILDNLPPFQKGRLGGRTRRPVRLQECMDWFRQEYPKGFKDPAYVGNAARMEGERAYKWEAHELWAKTLDGGRGQRLLAEGKLEELTDRAHAVDNKVNLLSRFEKMALRDGLREPTAAKRFFEALFELIESGPTQTWFIPYLDAVANLPAEEGKARVNSWPVATLFPYLARPDRFMFLKPQLTRETADIMAFDLHYDATPNWLTYAKLMELSNLLLDRLKELKAKDMIDVQSFMWLVHQRATGLD